MEYTIDGRLLEIGVTEFEFPYVVKNSVVSDDVLAVCLRSINHASNSNATFELESEARNVLGFDRTGHRWHVDPAPDDRTDPEHVGYKYLFGIEGALYAVHLDGFVYQIDVHTGSLVDSWPWNELPIGDGTVDVTGEVQRVLEDDDRIYVRAREADITLHCFDKEGNRIWHSGDSRRGIPLLDDGALYEATNVGPRQDEYYLLDEETGERVKEVEPPDLSAPFD